MPLMSYPRGIMRGMTTPALTPDLPLVASLNTLESAAAGWLLGYSNANTRAAYLGDLRDFIDWCRRGEVGPLEVTRALIELYARELESDGASAATVGRRLSALSSFYCWCDEEGVIDGNPSVRVRRPKVPKESPTLGLGRDEALAFLAAAEEAGSRDHALACFLLLNGLRVSEACHATAEDLSEERGHRVLTIHGKGNRIDRIPLAPRTWDALTAALEGRTEGPLLLANDRSPLKRAQAARIVRRLTRAAGITKRISPHSLRHAAVTLVLDAGIPLRDAQDFARHADPRTTRRYDRARASLDRHGTYTLASYLTDEPAA